MQILYEKMLRSKITVFEPDVIRTPICDAEANNLAIEKGSVKICITNTIVDFGVGNG